jgi:hypothetical protein
MDSQKAPSPFSLAVQCGVQLQPHRIFPSTSHYKKLIAGEYGGYLRQHVVGPSYGGLVTPAVSKIGWTFPSLSRVMIGDIKVLVDCSRRWVK